MNAIQAFCQAKKQNTSNIWERIISLQAQNNIQKALLDMMRLITSS
jgi:hypothetical protein